MQFSSSDEQSLTELLSSLSETTEIMDGFAVGTNIFLGSTG
jgi:hypothetical protein